MKCDGTRAETRFRLSAKRLNPFKSAGASVQSTTGSRGVRISGSNAGYTKLGGSEGYWLPTPFASFPFTSPPVRHRVPSHFNWTLRLRVPLNPTLDAEEKSAERPDRFTPTIRSTRSVFVAKKFSVPVCSTTRVSQYSDSLALKLKLTKESSIRVIRFICTMRKSNYISC